MGFPYTEKQSVATDRIVTRVGEMKFKLRKVIELFDKKSIKIEWGPNLRVPLAVNNSGNAQIYQAFEPLSFNPLVNIRAAQYSWYNRHDAMAISGDDWRETSGEEGKVNLVEAKAKIMMNSMMDQLDTDFFSTTTGASRNPLGFRAVGGTGATSVGGLTTTEVATWVAERDTTAGALTIARISAMIRNLEQSGADKKNLVIFVNSLTANKIDNALLSANFLRVPDKGSIAYGFSDITILGVPVITDTHVPGTAAGAANDSHIAIVDYDTMKMYVHRDNNFRVTDPTKAAYQQDSILRGLNTTLQFVCESRWRQGLFTAVDPAA